MKYFFNNGKRVNSIHDMRVPPRHIICCRKYDSIYVLSQIHMCMYISLKLIRLLGWGEHIYHWLLLMNRIRGEKILLILYLSMIFNTSFPYYFNQFPKIKICLINNNHHSIYLLNKYYMSASAQSPSYQYSQSLQ